MTTNCQFQAKEINEKLSGATIVNATIDSNGETFGFIVERNGKTFNVWVDCDAEGNGPGWLAIDS